MENIEKQSVEKEKTSTYLTKTSKRPKIWETEVLRRDRSKDSREND